MRFFVERKLMKLGVFLLGGLVGMLLFLVYSSGQLVGR